MKTIFKLLILLAAPFAVLTSCNETNPYGDEINGYGFISDYTSPTMYMLRSDDGEMLYPIQTNVSITKEAVGKRVKFKYYLVLAGNPSQVILNNLGIIPTFDMIYSSVIEKLPEDEKNKFWDEVGNTSMAYQLFHISKSGYLNMEIMTLAAGPASAKEDKPNLILNEAQSTETKKVFDLYFYTKGTPTNTVAYYGSFYIGEIFPENKDYNVEINFKSLTMNNEIQTVKFIHNPSPSTTVE